MLAPWSSWLCKCDPQLTSWSVRLCHSQTVSIVLGLLGGTCCSLTLPNLSTVARLSAIRACLAATRSLHCVPVPLLRLVLACHARFALRLSRRLSFAGHAITCVPCAVFCLGGHACPLQFILGRTHCAPPPLTLFCIDLIAGLSVSLKLLVKGLFKLLRYAGCCLWLDTLDPMDDG